MLTKEQLTDLGYNICPDPDQEGKWYWRNDHDVPKSPSIPRRRPFWTLIGTPRASGLCLVATTAARFTPSRPWLRPSICPSELIRMDRYQPASASIAARSATSLPRIRNGKP